MIWNWLDAEMWNVVCAGLGAGVGWWLRMQRDSVPPELAEALRLVLERQKKRQAEGLLAELFKETKS